MSPKRVQAGGKEGGRGGGVTEKRGVHERIWAVCGGGVERGLVRDATGRKHNA